MRRRVLGANVLGKSRLYLDIRYWCDFCDVALGENATARSAELLDRLRGAVRAGTVVCPIELHTFTELLKQRLPEKLRQTAELIDELSAGVTIVAPPERAFLEALRFLQAAPDGPPFPPAPSDEMWTKIAYLVGHGSFSSQFVPPEELERLNRLFEERLWSLGLVEALELLGPSPSLTFDWTETTVSKLNADKVQARADVRSYRALYLNEIWGVLDAFAPYIGDTAHYLFERSGGDPNTITESQTTEAQRTLVRLIHAAFEKHDLARQMPTIHIMASLFSGVQWDAGRKYRANDLADFGHAAAAIAYCNAFATERSLGSLIRQAKLDQQYGTEVLTSVDQLLGWLAGHGFPGPAIRGTRAVPPPREDDQTGETRPPSDP